MKSSGLPTRQRIHGPRQFVKVESPLSQIQYQLSMKQEPQGCRVLHLGEKVSERAIEPAPVVQLHIRGDFDRNLLQNPFLFATVSLAPPGEQVVDLSKPSCEGNPTETHREGQSASPFIAGCTVSSIHLVKDMGNHEAGVFVFPHVAVKLEGQQRLRFDLYEMINEKVVFRAATLSSPFTVYSPQSYPGPKITTGISSFLIDQGIKIPQKRRPRPFDDVEGGSASKAVKVEQQTERNQSSRSPSPLTATSSSTPNGQPSSPSSGSLSPSPHSLASSPTSSSSPPNLPLLPSLLCQQPLNALALPPFCSTSLPPFCSSPLPPFPGPHFALPPLSPNQAIDHAQSLLELCRAVPAPMTSFWGSVSSSSSSSPSPSPSSANSIRLPSIQELVSTHPMPVRFF